MSCSGPSAVRRSQSKVGTVFLFSRVCVCVPTDTNKIETVSKWIRVPSLALQATIAVLLKYLPSWLLLCIA